MLCKSPAADKTVSGSIWPEEEGADAVWQLRGENSENPSCTLTHYLYHYESSALLGVWAACFFSRLKADTQPGAAAVTAKHKDKYWLCVVHTDVSLCKSFRLLSPLTFFPSVPVSDLWTANMAWSSASSRLDNISFISPASTHYVKVSVEGSGVNAAVTVEEKEVTLKKSLLLVSV